MDFEAMVRNFSDLVEEGMRRTIRVARKVISRDALTGYALFPREGGTTARVSPPDFP